MLDRVNVPALISEDVKLLRRFFYSIWFGALALFALNAVYLRSFSGATQELFGLPALAVLGFLFMRTTIFDVADEVYDYGDRLLIRDRGREDYVPIANIADVGFEKHTYPTRLTLRLSTPCIFGTKIVFSPKSKFTLNPFAKTAIADDLVDRINRARGRNAV